MKDETGKPYRGLLWAMPASLLLHALIVALLVYGLPELPAPPPQEQAVNVALVPPPDQPKPKLAPPPPPKAAKVEKPPAPKVEKPTPLEKKPPKPATIEVLKPVFKFGDKDTGPRKSLDGDSAQAPAPAPALAPDDGSKPPSAAKEAENKSAASPDAEARADADKQEAAAPDADKPAAAVPDAPGDAGEVALPASAQVPQSRPANVPKPSHPKFATAKSGTAAGANATDASVAKSQRYSGLPGVRRLYSQGATGDAMATTSMAGMPRDQRAAKLCASVLQQELVEASYFPDLIPLIPLKAGNVLDAPEAAFRTRTTWHGLSFRCEVDPGATRVLSFAFRVRGPIPPDEWARLGLPRI